LLSPRPAAISRSGNGYSDGRADDLGEDVGDRYGRVTDPFGHEWSLATHKQDLTPEEIAKGAEAFFANIGQGHKK